MIPARSALIGVATAVATYAGMAGFSHIREGGAVALDAAVPISVSPKVSPTKSVTNGANSVPKKLAPTLAPELSVTPGARISPTPWPSTASQVASPIPTISPAASSSPSPTPLRASPTPWPSVSLSPTPTPTPVPTATVTPTPNPSPTPVPQNVRVVISEVAWMGTAANAADEWLELYNAGTNAVDLAGWTLCEGSAPIVQLTGSIGAGAYYLIERGDDDLSTSIQADLAHAFSGNGLANTGENLILRAGGCTGSALMDEMGPGPWYAGSVSEYASMERIDPMGAGSDPLNWASNDGSLMVGADAAGGPIRGTPAHSNSVPIQGG